jgi:WD40 repeat protein
VQSSDLSKLAAANKLGRSSFDSQSAKLRVKLADQLEKNQLRLARETVLQLLCLNPNDADALNARILIDEHLATAITHPVGEIRRLSGHQAWVNCVAFSPDGRFAVSASGAQGQLSGFRTVVDYSVRLWDVEAGTEIFKFSGHSAKVNTVAVSPDGKRVLSAGQEGGVLFIDVETGQCVGRVGKRLPPVRAALFADNGKAVVTASDDRVVRVWDVQSGERIARFEGNKKEVTAIAISPDGRYLLTACLDGSVRVFDYRNGQKIRKLEGHRAGVLAVAFLPDGKRAVSGGEDRTVRIWDLETGENTRYFMGHQYQINCVAVLPDGRHVVSGSADRTVRVWDINSGKEVKCLNGHGDSVESIAITPDGQQALSGSRDTSLIYWQLPTENVSLIQSGAIDSLAGLDKKTVPEWIATLKQCRLLEPTQETELVQLIAQRMPNGKALMKHLVERGWLTNHQVRHLAEGRGAELRLGDYIILKTLGVGGMGQVFLARRFGTTQELALKIVLPEAVDEAAALKQFKSEIQALSRMSHPNIIKTYEAGSDKGRHYFTMEFIEGTDLMKLVKDRGPLPVARACNYIRQAALGLEHAHEHCLIHRDIKPANLLLTLPRDHDYRPGESINAPAVIKVLDWGLAGLRRPTTANDASKPGAKETSVGTVDYMSPEQAVNMATVDIRADIYSLGCTLYHLLTGQPPFPGGNLFSKMAKHQSVEPPPIRELRKDVPIGVEEIVRKMMAKKPDDRYRSPAHLATALSPFCKE